MCTYECKHPLESKRRHEIHQLWQLSATQYGCWEPDLGPLQEQRDSGPEPSLPACTHIFEVCISHPVHISMKYVFDPLSPTPSSVYLQQWHILWTIFIYSSWLPLSSYFKLHLPPQFTLFLCCLSLLSLHPLSFPLLSVWWWTPAAPLSVSIIVLEPLDHNCPLPPSCSSQVFLRSFFWAVWIHQSTKAGSGPLEATQACALRIGLT